MVAEPESAAPSTPRKAEAAVMIQKTYRGYRARRKLADAAVMSRPVGWWNVVDSVVLHVHTQHYYAHSKSWKAHDNWKRLKRKASKVGKGLEKNNKALKLALQHWLEAVDARHRYGHNLRPYYLHWLELETCEPFFYWLDVGCGKQVELEKCSRATLLDQQIKYLSPDQRRHYEVVIYNGKLFYKMSGELVHTGMGKSDRWIFVMSPSGRLYIAKKQKGVFQHSSFLAGGATTAAGRLVVEHGMLRLMEAHSGHYRPSPENFEALVQILIASGLDLHLAKVQLVSDDLVEKEKGQKLAGEVRAGIEHAGAEGNVSVNIENQKLVTVDSGIVEGLSEYLVTNLTFPESDATRKNAAADHQDVQAKPEEADHQVEPTSTEAMTVAADQPVKGDEAPAVATLAAAEPCEESKAPTLKSKCKPCALVLPPPVDGFCHLNPNLPRTPTLPTSPGYSRIASLAELEPQERRQALKRYGPKKTALSGTPTKNQ